MDNTIDKRFALIAANGDILYPYRKKEVQTGREGFALSAPGKRDAKREGTYTNDIMEVVHHLVHDGWKVRAKTIDKVSRQRDGSFKIGGQAISDYWVAPELADVVKNASLKPLAVLPGKNATLDNVEHDSRQRAGLSNVDDELILKEIKTRRGQPEFRQALLEAYGGRCCFSGCTATEVLEAAHIIAHAEITDYSINNGLLLRADLHTLFDLHLIGVDGDRIRISRQRISEAGRQPYQFADRPCGSAQQ